MNGNVNVEDILAEMGWTDGFRIPIANEENRALELEIQKKHKEKDNLRSAVEDVTERVTAMKKHLINVKHELNQHQNLIVVQQGQVKIEENMLKTSQLEESSLHSEIKRMKKECDEISARQWTIQTDIKHVNAKLEKLKCTVKWDQDALLAWDEEVSRGCDDMTVLEKFSKEDELKFNELELRRQNLRMELENKRHKVHNAKNDLLCMEHSLEKTTQLFRKQHAERKALVQQWEASVKILHQRDEDINRVIEEIGNLKVLAKGRLKDLEEQKTFYETQAGNNKEIEKEISVLATESSLMKERLRLIEENLKDLNGNFITIKYALDKVNADLENLRAKKKRAEKEVESKAEQREHAETKLREVEEELEKVKSKKFSAVERAQRLEQLCKQEEKSVHEIGHESKKLNDLMVQVSEQLRELKETEKEQKSVLQKIESNMNAVKKEMVKAAKELHRQKELIYNADFQHMEKEIILNRMLGLAKEDNVEKYDKKIEELEECHDRLQAKNSLLSKEVARLEEERRRLTAEMHNDSKALEFLNSKKQDNILLTEGGLKQLKVMRRRTQELQVEENVMKLRVRQAEQAVEKMGGKLFSLEKQRLELEEAMRERELEINSLKDILLVRRRILIQQTANLSGRINLAKTKVEHLKKKYDVTVGKMGTDEDGQPLSLTEIKIKSAQERFELQEVGDKLDAKIKKTEREITALENTLQVIIASNKAFRNSLQNLDEQSPEFSEKEELEKALVKELDDLRAKKQGRGIANFLQGEEKTHGPTRKGVERPRR
ncbi:UNVERIFIED_CONTAM: hypothetical protein PYX00_002331 [Menopon gallinae]|uniref:Coiled-coil domain-containing protein 39 n=1 Tax=Menopon gallinae TaxID=328185 RepID=A0AAW2IHC5_9NEOP